MSRVGQQHGSDVGGLCTHSCFADPRDVARDRRRDDLREALDKAPPGIIDPRSWAYWNSVMGRYPAPPMPKRTLG